MRRSLPSVGLGLSWCALWVGSRLARLRAISLCVLAFASGSCASAIAPWSGCGGVGQIADLRDPVLRWFQDLGAIAVSRGSLLGVGCAGGLGQGAVLRVLSFAVSGLSRDLVLVLQWPGAERARARFCPLLLPGLCWDPGCAVGVGQSAVLRASVLRWCPA